MEQKTEKHSEEDLGYMRPRPMSKSKLSRLYAPGLKPKSALNRLAAWIRRNPALVAALGETYYTPKQQMLSTRQVRLIFQYLGEP